MIRKVLTVSAVLVLVGVLVGVAGCTNLASNPSPSTSALGQMSTKPTTQASASPTALPTSPPANIQSYAGPFVGSKNSNVYHYPWCYEAKKIEKENLVVFATISDACAAGYRPCEVCNPPACGPTPTPPATYQVVISGPTVLQWGGGGQWTATVYKNGVPISQADLANKIDWFIDGHTAGGFWGPGPMGGPGTLTTDANGESTTWAPYGSHTLNAEYIGDPSYPNTSTTVTSLGGPSVTPTLTPTPSVSPSIQLVGDSATHVYHLPSCSWVHLISAAHLVYFNSPAEAKAAGYRPCEHCNPPDP